MPRGERVVETISNSSPRVVLVSSTPDEELMALPRRVAPRRREVDTRDAWYHGLKRGVLFLILQMQICNVSTAAAKGGCGVDNVSLLQLYSK